MSRSICESRSPRLLGTKNKEPAEISASQDLRRAAGWDTEAEVPHQSLPVPLGPGHLSRRLGSPISPPTPQPSAAGHNLGPERARDKQYQPGNNSPFASVPDHPSYSRPQGGFPVERRGGLQVTVQPLLSDHKQPGLESQLRPQPCDPGHIAAFLSVSVKWENNSGRFFSVRESKRDG